MHCNRHLSFLLLSQIASSLLILSCSLRVHKESAECKTFMHNFPIKFLIIARRTGQSKDIAYGSCLHFRSSFTLSPKQSHSILSRNAERERQKMSTSTSFSTNSHPCTELYIEIIQRQSNTCKTFDFTPRNFFSLSLKRFYVSRTFLKCENEYEAQCDKEKSKLSLLD